MTSYPIGAQMFSLRDRTQTAEGLRETLHALKDMGYSTVQLSGHNQQIDPEEIADMLAETGLTCGATHFGFDAMKADPERIVRIHKLWNCAYPGIGAMPKEFMGSREGFTEFARQLSEVAKRFSGEGLHLLYHNHAFEFQKFDGQTGLELLMEQAAPEVQFEIDTYWVQAGGGDPVEWIRRAAGRMDVVHFKDMAGCAPANGTMTTMAPIGEGNLNWKKIMAACEEIGVKYAFIEQDNAVETDSLACMRRSRENLLKLGGRF